MANHSQQQWINTSCFTAPTVGLGNANRLPVVGPDFVNSDFSIIKQFARLWESMGLNFRAEFFNLFNHPQFGFPVNDIAVATVNGTGQITNPNGFLAR